MSRDCKKQIAADRIFISGLLPEEDLTLLLGKTGAGLETIQFSIADNLDRFTETLHREQELLERLGNPPLSIHGPFLDLNPMCYDSRIREVTRERFEQAYQAALILGARTVVFHSCMIPAVYFAEGWAERTAEFWNRFLEGKEGISVCMENVLDRDVSLFEEVLALVDHPDFGICLDIGHAHCYSDSSVLNWAKHLSGHIRHVHVHDNRGSRDEHLPLGSGSLPYKEVLSLLRSQRPDISWTIECNSTDDVWESWKILKEYADPDK